MRTDPLTSTVIHEAAHVVAALERGVVPVAVACGPSGGSVTLPADIGPEDAAVIAAAGVAAEQSILCDDRAEWSTQDRDLLTASAAKLDADIKPLGQWAFAQAGGIIGSKEREIVALANVLLKTPNLDRDQLRAACAPTTCLYKYRQLFPKPAAGPVVMRTRGRGEIDYPFLPRHEAALRAYLARR